MYSFKNVNQVLLIKYVYLFFFFFASVSYFGLKVSSQILHHAYKFSSILGFCIILYLIWNYSYIWYKVG